MIYNIIKSNIATLYQIKCSCGVLFNALSHLKVVTCPVCHGGYNPKQLYREYTARRNTPTDTTLDYYDYYVELL